ncbi:unnamed protein product [Owenia fusiformis]|uniref:DNA polymerase epsilon subunit n=1 Tax=Owenia fusiformis TaxID=6347 RepID=A0A8J1Y5E1_OWEFU|nr:unnamed protein product [Owenia fusiformis]
MSSKQKSSIVSAFKMHGLTLRSEASKYLVEALSSISESDVAECIDRIIESIQKQSLSSSMLDRATVEQAVEDCNQEQEEDNDKVLTVIDAFTVPRYTYMTERKKFLSNKALGIADPCIHGDSKDKVDLFRDRYTILHQRTSRHDLFTPTVIGSRDTKAKKFELKPIEFLLGSTAKLGDIIVLGMLTQLKEGKWFLEDPTGAVQLDLTKANFHTGLFTENSFVLAEGWYEDELFHINAFGFPPPEPSRTTRNFFGNINFFGGQSETSVKASSRLRQIEQENETAMFVFLSDLWLDNLKVFEKLRTLFTGFSESPPTCFVFSGNFSSTPYGSTHIKEMKDNFDTLANLILEFPSLVEHSKFIFIPGPRDPGPANILPRPSLPEVITQGFQEKIPNSRFTSNPCRIQYCTQEIVVFREDIVTKMCRNCVKFPDQGDVPEHFAKTIICQGHLCPLPLHVSPIYWAHDVALRTYPLPDVIVCADKYDSFSVSQVDCQVVNPGSFPRNDYSFKVYYPANRHFEESKISD